MQELTFEQIEEVSGGVGAGGAVIGSTIGGIGAAMNGDSIGQMAAATFIGAVSGFSNDCRWLWSEIRERQTIGLNG